MQFLSVQREVQGVHEPTLFNKLSSHLRQTCENNLKVHSTLYLHYRQEMQQKESKAHPSELEDALEYSFKGTQVPTFQCLYLYENSI